MKKTVGIIIALGLVVAVVMLLLPSSKSVTPSRETTASVAQYLPPDTMVVGMVSNVKTMITEIPKSPTGRLFGKETVHALMKEMQASPRDVAEYDEAHKDITNFLHNPSFQLLFGDSFTFAVLPIDLDKAIEEDSNAAAENYVHPLAKYFVAITTTTSPATLNAFSSLIDGVKVSQEKINGLDMLKVFQPERTEEILYAYIDGKNVLLAMDPAAISSCMANKQSGKPLTSAVGFTKVEQYWSAYPDERTYFRFAMNINSLLTMVTRVKNPEIKEALEEEGFGEMIDLYQGMGYVFGVTYTTSQTLESQYSLTYDPARLHPDMKRMLTEKATSNPYLFLLGTKPLIYYWGTPLDLQYFVNAFSTDPYIKRELEEASQELLGLALDEFCRSLGPQYGFALDSIADSGLFPIPKMTFWVEVREKALVEKGLANLVAKTREAGQAPVTEKVNESSFYSWALMPGDAGQPAVSIHNNTLYLTTSTQSMKGLLANTAEPAKMPEDTSKKLGKDLGRKIAAASSSAAIIYPAEIAPPVLSLIDFTNQYISGGGMPTAVVKKELGLFLASMDYMAGYCDNTGTSIDCTSVLKWAEQ